VRALLPLMLGLTVFACGGTQAAAPRATSRVDGGTAAVAPASVGPPGVDECAALVGHAMDVVQHERTDGVRFTEADRSNLRALADARCRAMPRASYACAMAATTADALQACDAPTTPTVTTGDR
jgi:hypothetical protein